MGQILVTIFAKNGSKVDYNLQTKYSIDNYNNVNAIFNESLYIIDEGITMSKLVYLLDQKLKTEAEVFNNRLNIFNITQHIKQPIMGDSDSSFDSVESIV